MRSKLEQMGLWGRWGILALVFLGLALFRASQGDWGQSITDLALLMGVVLIASQEATIDRLHREIAEADRKKWSAG